MQPETRGRKAVINDDVTTETLFIKSDELLIKGAHVIINGKGEMVIPPIRKGSVLGVAVQASKLEKVQWVVIGTTTDTIVAEKRYSVSLQFPRDRFDGGNHEMKIFAVEAPKVLSGTAATDRANIFTALTSKINSYVPQYTKATASFVYNTKSTGARTITAGTLLYLVGGTYVGMVTKTVVAGAVDTDLSIEMADFSGTRPTGATDLFALVSAGGTAVSKTSSAYIAAQGLVIYDESGYYPTKERLGRGGAPIIFSKNFAAVPLVIQAHVYSNGVGTDMLAHTPAFDMNKQNVMHGDWYNQYNESPVAGSFYTQYVVRVMGGGIPDAVDGRSADIPIEHILYVKETTQGTAMSAFETAIKALT